MQTLFLYQPFEKGPFISGLYVNKTIGFDLALVYAPELKTLVFQIQLGSIDLSIGWIF